MLQVRRTVREKLGEPTPLNQSLGTKVKKKKRAAANPGNRWAPTMAATTHLNLSSSSQVCPDAQT